MSKHLSPADFAERYLPNVTVDVVLLSIGADGALSTVLNRRTEDPYNGAWALPGVFVGREEPLAVAAARALHEKAGLDGVFVEQLFTIGAPDRDPRGRIISVAYYALVPDSRVSTTTGKTSASTIARIAVLPNGDAGAVEVFDTNGDRIDLAFDHASIIAMAIARIRGKLNYAPIGFELLPDDFTLFELQRIHEAVLGRKLNKDSFRRKMLASGLIEDTKQRQTGTAYRPAALYRFNTQGENNG
jgi:8-oxo-dGTP diphosphatase